MCFQGLSYKEFHFIYTKMTLLVVVWLAIDCFELRKSEKLFYAGRQAVNVEV